MVVWGYVPAVESEIVEGVEHDQAGVCGVLQWALICVLQSVSINMRWPTTWLLSGLHQGSTCHLCTRQDEQLLERQQGGRLSTAVRNIVKDAW